MSFSPESIAKLVPNAFGKTRTFQNSLCVIPKHLEIRFWSGMTCGASKAEICDKTVLCSKDQAPIIGAEARSKANGQPLRLLPCLVQHLLSQNSIGWAPHHPDTLHSWRSHGVDAIDDDQDKTMDPGHKCLDSVASFFEKHCQQSWKTLHWNPRMLSLKSLIGFYCSCLKALKWILFRFFYQKSFYWKGFIWDIIPRCVHQTPPIEVEMECREALDAGQKKACFWGTWPTWNLIYWDVLLVLSKWIITPLKVGCISPVNRWNNPTYSLVTNFHGHPSISRRQSPRVRN